jgi:hypothetical protein
VSSEALVAYAVLVAAAALAWRDNSEGLQLFAVVPTFLLVTGTHNAWDMLVFLVISSRGSA